MQAPINASQQLASPGALSWSSSFDRIVSLDDPADPLSVDSIQEILRINGKAFSLQISRSQGTLLLTTPEGRYSSGSFDDLGRVRELAFGDLAPTRFSYDERGLLTTIRSGSGDRERQVTLNYDTLGRLVLVTDPLGGHTGFAYDQADRLMAIALQDDSVVGLGTDARGRISSLTPPGRPPHEFSYTRTDQLKLYSPPEVDLPGSSSAASFNLDGQLVGVSTPGDKSVELGYDDGGRLTTVLLPEGQFTYHYDPDTGQLTTASSPDGIALAFGYDGFALRTTTWSGVVSGVVDHEYNENLLVTSQSVNGGNTVGFFYDDDGYMTRAGDLSIDWRPDVGLVSETTLGSVTTTYGYNEFGELSTLVASSDSAPELGLSFERDHRGRITEMTESGRGQTTRREFRYDDRGRLAEVLDDGARTKAYTYDANGNRVSETDSSNNVITAAYDDQDRLLSYGDVSYTYTANGELLSRTENGHTIAYSYDLLGNLLSVTLPDGLLVEYVHDAQGRRVGKKVNGILVSSLLYEDELNPIAELDGDGDIISRFVYATYMTVPDYMVRDGVTYRIVADHLGSPRRVVDVITGAIAQELRYDAFGNVLLDTNPGFQPFGFAGGLYDHQTGLVRFGLRDYDPQVGRWTAKDPILFAGGDTNLYGYTLADPVNFIDPLGESVWSFAGGFAKGFVTGVVVGALAVAAATAAPAAVPLLVVAGAIGAATTYYEGVALYADPCPTPDERHAFWGRLFGGLAGSAVGGYGYHRGYDRGGELSFGKDFRVAPFGNRTQHPQGRFPHYHRRAYDSKGRVRYDQGMGRHRPWEPRDSDQSLFDRF
jgi:RHS repeat-associated protein